MGLSMGTWWLRSESDPRWNVTGRGEVGMFMTIESCPEARYALEAKRGELNEQPPDDLEFGYMKD